MFFPAATDELVVNSTTEQPSQPAFLNLPQSDASGERKKIICSFGEREGNRLVLYCQTKLATSAAVSVEYDDAMFLAEVVHCAGTGEGEWRVELQIEQVLTGLQSLIILRSRLLGEPSAPTFAPVRSTLSYAAA